MRRLFCMRNCALLCAAVWALTVLTAAHAALPPALLGEKVPSLAPMLERVMPAVVNISTTSTVSVGQNPLLRDPFFRYFFQLPDWPRRRRTQSLGSGVIIDADDGIVVTNSHVVEQAEQIKVVLQDGRSLDAELVGLDEETDVAVIKIPPDGLTEIELGDSDALRVGDFAIAIGNPFGLSQTVTSGIISALGRSGLGIEGYEDFIQTDASINPGNSGGALVNLKGELIGINTAILAPSGGNVGIGFAIPINMVQQLTDQLIEFGRIQRGRLGVYVQDLTRELAQAFGIERLKGAVIAQVLGGSAAERSGLRQGDVVITVNRRAIEDASDLRNAVGLLRVGQVLEMRILREGEEQVITARIDEAVAVSIEGEKLHQGLAGATFSELTKELHAQGIKTGVRVARVRQSSKIWIQGLRADDIILAVNGTSVDSVQDFTQAVSGKNRLRLDFRRGNRGYYLTIN